MKPYSHTISSGLESGLSLSRRSVTASLLISGLAAGVAGGFAGMVVRGAHGAEAMTQDMVMGDANAPITIIEYASFTCPHCASFHAQTLPGLKKAWIDTGKAKLIFRDFPLDEMAFNASKLARCADENRYFAFVEVLFRQQGQWARSRDPIAALGKLGRLGGIGKARFDACLSNEALGNAILQSRVNGAREFEVNSTPTLIINGEKHAGALSFEELDRVLAKLAP